MREQSLDGYVGCTFVGFWHPGHPTVVPQITIQRAADTPETKTKTSGL